MDRLVSTDWLAAHCDAADLVVLDASLHLPSAARDARAEFEAGHIPGAHFLDLGTLNDGAGNVPDAQTFASRMRALGVSPSSRVVLYDDSDLRSAARAWFIFRLHAVAEVAILDGGLEKWRAEGRSLERGIPDPVPSRFEAVAGDGAVRDKRAMLANLESRAEQVIDARDAGRFTGETIDTVHNLPGGHIPGARNVFFATMFDEDGTYRKPEELRRIFAQGGVDPHRPLVTSCGSGITAAAVLFALQLAGREDVALYDGSWSEWGADPATPKETGPARAEQRD